jgi:hypothetical protein
MFDSRPTENGLGMTDNAQTQTENREHARPEDPETNTRPPGNGERDEPDADRAQEKLNQVSGH